MICDSVYGKFEIDKVLQELIESKPVQRLKGIHQGGASYLVNEKWNVTRFEHSVGVMLLIKKLGGSVEEQIAGLLHDVSHTAFSHVIDFVLDNLQEDYHEKIYRHVITNSEIPTILTNYGYDDEKILFDDSKWMLLEQPAPELCADRVDYTLRDMLEYGKISMEEVQDFLNDLIIIDGKMYLQNIEIAAWFVKVYYEEVIDFFMDPLNIYGYDILAKALKAALSKNILTVDDLLGMDHDIMNILKSSTNLEVQSLLKQLHQNVHVIEDPIHFHVHRNNKVRLIDPSVFYNKKLVKASTLSEKVMHMSTLANEKARTGCYVRIISN